MKETLVPEIIRACVEWIRNSANDDWGFPGDNEESSSCSWVTIGLTLASWTAGIEFRELYMRQALMWVASQRNEDGGIPSTLKLNDSITDATAQMALACSLAVRSTGDQIFTANLEKCIRWLMRTRSPNGGWRWSRSDRRESVASTAFVILALHSSEINDVELSREVETSLLQAVHWLKRIQNADGGWGFKEGDKTRAATTALVASTFCEIGERCNQKKIIKLLLSKQDPDGSWEDVLERAGGGTITRIGTACCVRGLALCGYDMGTRQFRSALDAVHRKFDKHRFRYRDYDVFSWPTRDHMLALTAVGKRQNIASCRTFSNLSPASRKQVEFPANASPPSLLTLGERKVLIFDLKQQTVTLNGDPIGFKRQHDRRFCALVAIVRVIQKPCGKNSDLFVDEHLKAWREFMAPAEQEPNRNAARQHYHYLREFLTGRKSSAAQRRFAKAHLPEDLKKQSWLMNTDRLVIDYS